MSADTNKENIADGLLAPLEDTSVGTRKAKKSRSLSAGPGSLNVPLKEESGNRRKSTAILPAVKSILSGKDNKGDAEAEAARKAARRKSLANRRVSFAPEATLHTWNLEEYIRDATSSSASSENTRRASTVSEETSSKDGAPSRGSSVDPSEPPSTPPEQIEDVVFPGSTPKNQRDLHQKKRRRRSSGIPPMNFNNPDDTFSSSPASGSSPLVEEDSDNDMGDATMDLDEDRTGQIVAFEESSSSARLDEALRQASTHAGAPVMAADETGDMTMEMAEDEATHAFQSWIGKKRPDNVAHQLSSVIDQENVNPFHPATTSGTIAPFSPADTNGETPGDISMDMTRALGVIVQQQSRMPKLISPAKDTTVPKGIKRRRSSANIGVTADSSGSPLKRPNTRRSMSRQLASAEETLFGDATMDLTMAVGGIQQKSANIADSLSLLDASLDETMDFTMAVGGIQSSMPEVGPGASEGLDATALEELSMELTGSLGKAPITSGGTSSLSPRKRSSPAKRASPAKKSSPGKDLMLAEMSDLPPTVTIDRPETPRKTPRQLLDVPGSSQKPEVSNRKSPRKSPRKSMFPGLLSPAVISTPVPQAIQKPAKVAEKEIESSKVSTTTLVLESTTHGQKSSPSRAPASKTTSLVDSIRLLSTPRKPVLPTPVLKASNTPKKLANTKKQVSPRHVLTPLRHSPQKRVRMDVSASPKKRDGGIARSDPEQDGDQEMERISLQDFLTMTNIRFMDLTTTKRRATGHPGADGGFASAFNPETEETEANFENSVAAAVGIVPMLSMYQHSCHEMKSYISSGRTEVRDLETAAYQTQPPLFHEYASAPAGEKTIMDAQFKNLKTNARLQSKAGWHAWRSQLLSDLKSGLLQTGQELEQDGKLLEQMDLVLQEIIPTLSEQQLQLETEMHRLEERKRDSEEGTGDELNAARDQLLAAEKELLEKRALFENLQSQLRENESSIDDARSWKVETTAAIKEAERVSEEFRGWSANEVLVLKGKLQALEKEQSWSLFSLDGPSITLSYKKLLHLTIHPRAFVSRSITPAANAPNAPISLSYVGPEEVDSSTPAATVQRFFLQLLYAHAHSLPQCDTRAAHLLGVINRTWDLAERVTEAVAALQVGGITDVHIIGDQKLAIETQMLLASLTTKVKVRFEIGVSVGGEDGPFTTVSVGAKVVYGEKYDEPKMGDFLGQFVGGKVGARDQVRQWAVGVEDLRARLTRRGTKGVRV